MKIQRLHILTLLVIFLATLYLLLGSREQAPEQVVVISAQPREQPPTYFGAATIAPPAFPVYGIPTRPLRELGGWRANYGL